MTSQKGRRLLLTQIRPYVKLKMCSLNFNFLTLNQEVKQWKKIRKKRKTRLSF